MPTVSRRDAITSIGVAIGALAQINTAFALSPGQPTQMDDGWTPLNLAASRTIAVPVRLNGRTVPAMIDSGTSRSVIGRTLALELGLTDLGETAAQSFTKKVYGSIYSADQMELPGIALRNIPLESFDVTEIEGIANRQIPLILGRDILRQIDLEVDFVGDRARCLPLHDRPTWPGHAALPLVGERASFPSISLALEGHKPQFSLVDFGSDAPVTMAAEYARTARFLTDRKVSTAVIFGMEGVLINGVFTLRDIRLGSFLLHQIPVQVVENWKLPEPVSVGWPLFRAFDAVLSLGSKTMWLKADQTILAADFPKDRLGMFGRREVDRMVVLHVAEGSPAWVAGIRDNDIITSIDGQRITDSYPPRMKRLAFQPAGTSIALGLIDGRQMALVLADYF